MVVVGLAAGMLARRRTHDDVHSVEHYHRQLHTLEEMRTHLPSGSSGGQQNGNDDGLPGQRIPCLGVLDGAPDGVRAAARPARPAATGAQSLRAGHLR